MSRTCISPCFRCGALFVWTLSLYWAIGSSFCQSTYKLRRGRESKVPMFHINRNTFVASPIDRLMFERPSADVPLCKPLEPRGYTELSLTSFQAFN
eukprot:jgi/Botrbrau1/7315/Bobra.247_3s0010.1